MTVKPENVPQAMQLLAHIEAYDNVLDDMQAHRAQLVARAIEIGVDISQVQTAPRIINNADEPAGA